MRARTAVTRARVAPTRSVAWLARRGARLRTLCQGTRELVRPALVLGASLGNRAALHCVLALILGRLLATRKAVRNRVVHVTGALHKVLVVAAVVVAREVRLLALLRPALLGAHQWDLGAQTHVTARLTRRVFDKHLGVSGTTVWELTFQALKWG